jgi:hypothetical protein
VYDVLSVCDCDAVKLGVDIGVPVIEAVRLWDGVETCEADAEADAVKDRLWDCVEVNDGDRVLLRV